MMKLPINQCSEEDMAIAREFGERIESKDGNSVMVAYRLDGKLYVDMFNHLPLQLPPPGADESPASSSRTEHPKADSQP